MSGFLRLSISRVSSVGCKNEINKRIIVLLRFISRVSNYFLKDTWITLHFTYCILLINGMKRIDLFEIFRCDLITHV